MENGLFTLRRPTVQHLNDLFVLGELDGVQKKIAENCPPLLKLHNYDHAKVKALAQQTINTLAYNDFDEPAIIAKNAFLPLIELACIKETEIQVNAIWTMALLSLNDRDFRIPADVGWKSIFEYASRDNEEVKTAAATLMANLARFEENRVDMIKNGGLTVIMELSKGPPAVSASVTPILSNLAVDEELIREIVNSGALDFVINNLGNIGNIQGLRGAVSTVSNIANSDDDPDLKERILQPPGLESILSLLSHEDEIVNTLAASAVGNLASEEKNEEIIVRGGAVPLLIKLATSDCRSETKLAAVRSINNLSQNQEAKTIILENKNRLLGILDSCADNVIASEIKSSLVEADPEIELIEEKDEEAQLFIEDQPQPEFIEIEEIPEIKETEEIPEIKEEIKEPIIPEKVDIAPKVEAVKPTEPVKPVEPVVIRELTIKDLIDSLNVKDEREKSLDILFSKSEKPTDAFEIKKQGGVNVLAALFTESGNLKIQSITIVTRILYLDNVSDAKEDLKTKLPQFVKMVDSANPDSKERIVALKFLGALARNNLKIQLALKNDKTLDNILKSFKSGKEQPEALGAIFLAIAGCVAGNRKLQNLVRKNGAIKKMMSCAKTANLKRELIFAVTDLMKDDKKSQIVVLKNGGIELGKENFCSNYVESDLVLSAKYFAAFCEKNAKVQNQIRDINGVFDWLLQSCKQFPENQQLTFALLHFLNVACADNAKTGKAIATAAFVDVLVANLKNTSKKVVLVSLQVCWELIRRNKDRQELFKKGGIEDKLKALKDDPSGTIKSLVSKIEEGLKKEIALDYFGI